MDAAIDFDTALMAGDLALDGSDLVAERGLKSAIVMSLFLDSRAGKDDVLPAGAADRRGWWGDLVAPIEGDRIGSRLWTLSREKVLPAVVARAESFAAEALQWLLDDGIAAKVTVRGEIFDGDKLGLAIQIDKPQGDPVSFRFEDIWKGV